MTHSPITIPKNLDLASYFVLIMLLVFPRAASGADDLETIRARIVAPLLAAPEAASVVQLMNSFQPDDGGSTTDQRTGVVADTAATWAGRDGPLLYPGTAAATAGVSSPATEVEPRL